ncbi:TetR/AcrR family transcriptional regulator [Actinocorallia aurea]
MSRPGPRERLIEAARDLTYRKGVNVGVDAILEQAGVARRSLYQHFGGKDELVAEVLRSARGPERYERVMAAAGDDPVARLSAVFDEIERITGAPEFRGCRYTAAELSLGDPAHPAHAEVRAYKESLQALFAAELARAGHPDPAFGADQLVVLIDGVLAQAATRPHTGPARAARALAGTVLGTPLHPSRTP